MRSKAHAQEDEALRALIEVHGTKKWSLISSELGSKSSKQCRRRWKNALSIDAKATTWSVDEDARLVALHRELGNKWTEISRRFGDRTDNAVKNRWHALCRKQPDLAEEESPITTVGVRHGTRTRLLAENSSGEYSQRPAKRIRRGTSSGGTVGGGSRSQGTAAHPPTGPQGMTNIPGMPTPFDQQRGHPPAPINIYVNKGTLSQHELHLVHQVNSLGVPVHIEVAELNPARPPTLMSSFPEFPADWAALGGDGGGGGSWKITGNRSSGSVGGGGGALFHQPSFSMNDILAWLNSSTAAQFPGSGDGLLLGQGSDGGSGQRGGSDFGLPLPRMTRGASLSQHRSGSGSGSGSGGLLQEHRELLTRLMSRAKSSAEQAQQAQQQQAQPSQAELNFLNSLQVSLPSLPEGLTPGWGGLSLAPSLGLSQGMGQDLLGSSGQLLPPSLAPQPRVDPLRRTRSSSNSGGSKKGQHAWAEAAAAAVAAVDAAPQPPPAAAGPPPAAVVTRRTSSRERRAASERVGGGVPPLPLAFPEVPDVALLPSFTQQEIDLIIEAINLPSVPSFN